MSSNKINTVKSYIVCRESQISMFVEWEEALCVV